MKLSKEIKEYFERLFLHKFKPTLEVKDGKIVVERKYYKQKGENNMNFIVRLTYLDDKSINVSLSEAEVPIFLEKLKKNEAYSAPDSDNAFWTPKDQVRFVNIAKEQPPIEPIVEETPTEEIKE